MDKELIRRYFENRVSAEEKDRVAEWLLRPENEQAVLDYLESAYASETDSVRVRPFSDMFRQAQNKEAVPGKLISLKYKWLWAASAACVLFLIGAGAGYYFQNRGANGGLFSLNTAYNKSGQYAQLTLSDGSEVYLGSDSRLSFPKEMNVHPVVYLEGEAYFNLRKEGSAVTVKTRDLVTTGKGSKFNIRAFSKDSTVTVTVEKGKVELTNNNETFPLLNLRFLNSDSSAVNENAYKPKVIPLTRLLPALTVKANEEATYDKNTSTTGIKELRPGTMPMLNLRPVRRVIRPVGSFSDSDFNFYKEDISEMVNRIEQRYNVIIDLDINGNHLQSFTGEFARDADLNVVLDRICNTIGLEYSINDNRVKINLLK